MILYNFGPGLDSPQTGKGKSPFTALFKSMLFTTQ